MSNKLSEEVGSNFRGNPRACTNDTKRQGYRRRQYTHSSKQRDRILREGKCKQTMDDIRSMLYLVPFLKRYR